MSSVWTGMACEAGREERGPKVRAPSPLDLHWSNLKDKRKESKGGREGKELPCLLWKEGRVTHHSCATEGIMRARYSVSRRSRVPNADMVGSKRCLGRRDRGISCGVPKYVKNFCKYTNIRCRTR